MPETSEIMRVLRSSPRDLVSGSAPCRPAKHGRTPAERRPGRREDTREILLATHSTFRARAPKLFAGKDFNEAEAMIELCHEINRILLQFAGGERSCPAFMGCYNEDLGTVCYADAGHTLQGYCVAALASPCWKRLACRSASSPTQPRARRPAPWCSEPPC